MDNNVKIALVQFQSKLNCPDENVEKACGMIAQAASQGAKIVCFPELFNQSSMPFMYMKSLHQGTPFIRHGNDPCLPAHRDCRDR